MYESDQTELESYGESTGCYYNYNHYGEGDRIMTNEPCLNCTCHDRMLMCYLRVCPFTKAIGQDCTIEKREDQCCPVITCPEVEVQLVNHQTTASPSNALGATSSNEVGALDHYGCSINDRFYPEGAQVPSNPQKPCELCYCIRNMTTCVMQECTLHIDGCQPIYNKGVCCPVKYDCDHDKDATLMLEDESTTTVRPTPGFILTTTVSPSVSTDCVHNGESYADGALIMTDKPCEHCYCMRGDIVCAVQECGTPLENEGKNCTALPPAVGQCCPDKYICDGSAAAMITTTVPSVSPSADDEEQEQEQQTFEKDQSVSEKDSESLELPLTTTQGNTESTTLPQEVHDIVPVEKDDTSKEEDQQEQEHVAPQFEDTHTDDSREEDDIQTSDTDDDGQHLTTAHPSLSGDSEIENDHIPGHIGSHEDEEDKPEEATTVVTVDAPLTTTRPAVQSILAEHDETSTVSQVDAEVQDATGTTLKPSKDTPESEAEEGQIEEENGQATTTPEAASDDVALPTAGTTISNDENIEQAITTALPSELANADEKENEIYDHHDKPNAVETVQPEHDESLDTEDSDEQKEQDEQIDQKEQQVTTTPAVPVDNDVTSEQELQTYLPSGQPAVPEQDKPEVSTDKKEPAQKADDETPLHVEQDFVELPPAVVVTELPPIPTTSDEPSTTDHTPEPPKDEILPNMPLEADSYVLSDSMTTEHAPTFGDRKEDNVQEPEPSQSQGSADMDEPVEMNTIIPLDTEEQKVEQAEEEKDELAPEEALDQDSHVAHDSHDDDEDAQNAEEPEVVTTLHDDAQPEEDADHVKDKDEQLTVSESPDKLFPESIPGEGDCLIEGVTYENGASVPPSGKCQVACHCSNSIVHCEMVRCEASPSIECTPKNTLPGECCPTYSCPKETSSTMSSTSVESTEVSTESDADSEVSEEISADVSESDSDASNSESSETSTKATITDSQSLSTDEENDDESVKPSETESDSAGFDVDDEVFKPLRPKDPFLDDTHINFFAGNRPTTANYDDEIILTTPTATRGPVPVSAQDGNNVQDPIELGQSEQDAASGTTQSSISETTPKEETTTATVVEHGSEAEENEVIEQDEQVQRTTAKPEEAGITLSSVVKTEEDAKIDEQFINVQGTTSAVQIDEQENRVTTVAADEEEEEEEEKEQVQATTAKIINVDQEQEANKLDNIVPTSSPVAETQAVPLEQDEKQVLPASTTLEPTEEDTAEIAPDQPQTYEEDAEPSPTTIRTDVKPLSNEKDNEVPEREATTPRATETSTERDEQVTEQDETVPEHDTKRKTTETSVVHTISAEQDEEYEKPATTTQTSATVGPDFDDHNEDKETVQLSDDEVHESSAVTTTKPLIQEEPTTVNEQETTVTQKSNVAQDEEQSVTTGMEFDVSTSVAPQVNLDQDNESNRKTTVTQQTTTLSPNAEYDDKIIFPVDEDENSKPVVKPTLDGESSTQNTVKPTYEDVKPTQDTVKPQSIDEKETDDDNLISPVSEAEQDGGFHFPQEDDDEADEPIFKPTIDEHPLPAEIPQNTVPLEPVDQIKEQEDTEEDTVVDNEQVAITSSTVAPQLEEQEREKVTPVLAENDQKYNDIEADIKPIAVPEQKPEQVPMYDEIEETEQQTVEPNQNVPKPTTIALELESEPQHTTEVAEQPEILSVAHDKPESDDEQDQPITQSSPIDTIPVSAQDIPQENNKIDSTISEVHLEDKLPTTSHVSLDDVKEEEYDGLVTTTASGDDEQEHKQQTTPLTSTSDAEEQEEHLQIHDDKYNDEDKNEDETVATTPKASGQPASQDEIQTVEQVTESEVQSVAEYDEHATTPVALSADTEQTTSLNANDGQTLSPELDETVTTSLPVLDTDKEVDEKPDFSAVDDNSDASTVGEDNQFEYADQQTDKPPKVPVAHAADDASEEVTESAPDANISDDTEVVMKDSQEIEQLENDGDDQHEHTTLSSQVSQNEKHKPQPEPAVMSEPQNEPMEDDVDFEQEQQKVTTEASQTISEQDQQTTMSSQLDSDSHDEKIDAAFNEENVDPEKERVTTAKTPAVESDEKHEETPEADLIESSDDVDDEVTHSTTIATPEQTEIEDTTHNVKPIEKESDEISSTMQPPNAVYDDAIALETDSQHKDIPSNTHSPVTTAAPVNDDDSQENEKDGQGTTARPSQIDEEDNQTSTTPISASVEPEIDLTSEGDVNSDTTNKDQTTEVSIPVSVSQNQDKTSPSAQTTELPEAFDTVESDANLEEEHDEVEQPQTDDLNADDESSEEEEPSTATTTPSAPEKASTETDESSIQDKVVTTDNYSSKDEVYTTVAPVSAAQETEKQTTEQQESDTEKTVPPIPHINTTTTSQPSQDEIQTTSTPVVSYDEDKKHSEIPDSSPAPATTIRPAPAETEGPAQDESQPTTAQDDFSQTTVAPASAQDDKLHEKVDEEPALSVVHEKPQPVSDASGEQQEAVKPVFPEDDHDDQQKVQEPEVAGVSEESSSLAKPTPQPETVGPSYGAPGQHYDTGYGHMPPHYPPSSYEDDYGEEEDPAAFGPGTCRYGGKLYVSAQQIPRDDPCDFCFCFRSDIICLQQSCPPPISGCNEEPIAGFCCPRYECPVSMATVLNVTTSTTTTTTTLPPHFLSHAYKGHVQKRGCQIQGKPYNVGETVASASGPCMRCTCGGDGQMQCEPKACSPEPMLQQMIAVAAARRR
uniref:VWFC domain-containing protein n=1 Tax=Anopheles epiroticus TaxID=199890 RepID=A0A182PL15_9DIPT